MSSIETQTSGGGKEGINEHILGSELDIVDWIQVMFQQLQCILAAKANRLMAEEDCDGLGVARFRFWACLRPANFARELVCKYKVLMFFGFNGIEFKQ